MQDISRATAGLLTRGSRSAWPAVRAEGSLTDVAPSGRGWIALGVLLAAVGVFLFHETRGTTFWFDEWVWVLHRRGNDLGSYLDPHNGHLSLVPVTLYKLLFATSGLADYRPFRALVTIGHLTCAALVFVYARRRVGDVLALIAATPLLLLGPAWPNVLGGFQVAWLIALSAGVGALLLLDRRDRIGDLGACVLVCLALGSSGVGVPIALGIAVDVLWGRRRRQDAWIFAVPLALYALWALKYAHSTVTADNILRTPQFVADSVAADLAALTGQAGSTGLDGPGTLLTWGPPLAVVAATVLVWRLGRMRPIPARVPALLATVFSFWALTGASRAGFTPAVSGRYLYVGALFLLLLAVELLQGARVPPWAGALAAMVVGVAAVSNVGAFRDGGRYLRDQAAQTRADLGALDLARTSVPPDYTASGLPGTPLVTLDARSYFAAEAAHGTPADTPQQIAGEPDAARAVADAELVRIHRVALEPGAAGSPRGPRPTVVSAGTGVVSGRGACLDVRTGPLIAAAPAAIEVVLPPAGVSVTAVGGSASAGVRRFGTARRPLGTVGDGSASTVRIGPDRAPQPWVLRVAPTARATVCGLG